MAIVAAVNFLGVKALADTNSALTWWKVAIPLLDDLHPRRRPASTARNFHAADGFNPYGVKGILLAIPTSGIIFSYLGFEQADQLAGECKNPKRDIPLAVIGSIVLGMIIYILLQVVFLLRCPPTRSARPGPAPARVFTTCTGPFAEVGHAASSLGWLATILYIDAVVSPAAPA